MILYSIVIVLALLAIGAVIVIVGGIALGLFMAACCALSVLAAFIALAQCFSWLCQVARWLAHLGHGLLGALCR